jgi:hypothetical protein
MKLDSPRIDQALNQFDAHAIPGDHPVVAQLNQMFGEHTFFLNSDGLHVVEEVDEEQGGTQPVQVVKLASWKDDNCTSLQPHEPEATDVVVMLASGEDEDEENLE